MLAPEIFCGDSSWTRDVSSITVVSTDSLSKIVPAETNTIANLVSLNIDNHLKRHWIDQTHFKSIKIVFAGKEEMSSLESFSGESSSYRIRSGFRPAILFTWEFVQLLSHGECEILTVLPQPSEFGQTCLSVDKDGEVTIILMGKDKRIADNLRQFSFQEGKSIKSTKKKSGESKSIFTINLKELVTKKGGFARLKKVHDILTPLQLDAEVVVAWSPRDITSEDMMVQFLDTHCQAAVAHLEFKDKKSVVRYISLPDEDLNTRDGVATWEDSAARLCLGYRELDVAGSATEFPFVTVYNCSGHFSLKNIKEILAKLSEILWSKNDSGMEIISLHAVGYNHEVGRWRRSGKHRSVLLPVRDRRLSALLSKKTGLALSTARSLNTLQLKANKE